MLTSVALKALSPAPSSTPCEQWFSSAADLYGNRKRNKLSLSRARMILFLQKAAPSIQYNYELKWSATEKPIASSTARDESDSSSSDDSDMERDTNDDL